MSKKPLSQRAKEDQLVAWYKWEFLRRNVEYKKDYEDFIRQFGDWFEKHGYWYDRTIEPWGSANLRFFETVIAPKAKIICEKWEIQDPFSPDWQFTKSGAYFYKPHYEVLLPTDCDKKSAGAQWDFSDLLLSDDDFAKTLPRSTERSLGTRPGWLFSLRFDLRLPLSSLLRQAREQITSRKKRYIQVHPDPARTAPANRRRLDLYAVYLKVWDLRATGEKFEAIGASMFPGQLGAGQRANDSFKRAQELIDCGYKELR